MIHRWANLLNEAGIRSRVIQAPRFGIPDWDGCPPPESILADPNEVPTEEDTVIIPEVLAPMPELKAKRKIVFVQNHIWITPNSIRPDTEVLVCSRYLFNHIERVYGVTPIGIVKPYLCDTTWQVTSKEKDRVLVMARRNEHWKPMVEALMADNFLITVGTEPVSQREIADAFKNCEYYVHLVYPEGFPALCLEAMRSGTIVVGTTGGGGNEFLLRDETAMVVGDPKTWRTTEAEFIAGIMSALRKLRSDAELRERIARQAFEISLGYTAEMATKQLLAVFA